MDTQRSILVVEDVKSIRSVLVDRFAREGYNMLEAEDGKEGLDVALEKHPDLILLDIVMPVMDGVTMLHQLRQDEWGKNVKVIVLTNLVDADVCNDDHSKGKCKFSVKTDWSLDDVVKKVENAIK